MLATLDRMEASASALRRTPRRGSGSQLGDLRLGGAMRSCAGGFGLGGHRR
jgi:hypothetical protein